MELFLCALSTLNKKQDKKTKGAMRYLLHSGNATYDATTKKYTYTLDHRIQDPKSIRLVKASYVAATSSTYPAVVYVKSDGLSQLCKTKHTVELKNQSHQDGTNIFAVLEERHTQGKYSLEEAPRTLPVKMHENVTTVDVYFTDNDTVLGNAATSGGSSSSTVTDADIEAFDDLTIWVDLHPSRTLTAAFAECSALGDLPKFLYSRSPSPAALIMQGNWDFELVNFKTGLLGISRDTDPATGHGQALSDSTFPTSVWEEEFQVHHIFKAHPGFNDTVPLFKLNNNECRVFLTGGGAVKFKNVSGGDTTLSNIAWVPSRVYIVSIKRVASGSSYNFEWRWEDVDNSTVLTETTGAGAAISGNEVGWSYGISGQYYRHVGGPLIGANGIDSTEFDTAITWLKQWYAGEGESSSSSTVTSTPASFFLELEIKT